MFFMLCSANSKIEESEEIVNQVFDEIGIDLNQAVCICICVTFVYFFSNEYQLGNTPSTITSTANKEQRVAQAVGGGDDDLQARLDSLRR